MGAEPVLVDAGPLVALFRKNEKDHQRCKVEFGKLGKGLPTTWPVLTEAFFLLRNERQAVKKLVRILEEGLLVARELGPDFPTWFGLGS